jgi:RNase P subunit RPR2
VGRRGIKEYRAAEALLLISADRDGQALACPTCSTPTIQRSPTRESGEISSRITLRCGDCGRSATYLDRGANHGLSPEAPRITIA